MNDNASEFPQWQDHYDTAIGNGGVVTDVFAERGYTGAIAIWVAVRNADGSMVYYSPYLNQSPGDGEHEEDNESCGCEMCTFEADPDAWLDAMASATDWSEWDWGPGESGVPSY